MKNRKLLSALLLLTPFFLFAQPKLSTDFNVTVAKPFAVVDAGSKEYFSDGTHIVSVKTRGQKVTIQKFSIDDMKEVKRKEYEEWPPYLKVQSIMKMKGKLYYIYTSYDKKGKYHTIYSREINTDDLSLGAQKLLFKSEKKIISSGGGQAVGFMGMRVGGSLVKVFKSFDESKILLSYRNAPKTRDDAVNFDVLGFHVFDSNLEKQWGDNVKMPYTEKVMNNLAYGIDKAGNGYMLAYITKSKKFELFSINTSAELKTHELDAEGSLFFTKLELYENSAGNLVVAGLYSNGLDFKMGWGGGSMSNNVNGIIQYTMTKQGKILSTYDMEFSVKLINQYKSARAQASNERRESKGKLGISDLKMQKIVTNADGSTIFLAEQHYTKRVRTGKSTTTYYYYRDMVITKINKKGTVIWQKKVPKTQSGKAGKGGMGVAYVQGKNSHYLLFLDNAKNANLSLSKVPAQHQDGRGGFLTAYKINDATGEVERHSIFDVRDVKGTEAFQFKTTRIFEVKDNVFMVEVYIKGKEDTMIKMELNQ